ncbi:MAG: DUF58 domain-containing protein [Melioribacteraceae bacterium]|nr:DUF58 domain-containing protein [Melioribacteraceae bacterium]MDD3557967.1 DUF58 domain-containing protein [Melioribacteraceae bacterium]
MRESRKSYKSLLDPSIVSKLKSLDLIAKKVVEGFIVGLHKSPYHGFSVEFSEHRSYMQGDSVKDMDWKVYAKTEKFYIKKYEEETNLLSHVIIDSSKSMDYKHTGSITKLSYVKILASSLIYLMHHQSDATGLIEYSDEIKKFYPPKTTRVYTTTLIKEIANLTAGNATQTSACLGEISERINKRGLVIVISDLLDDPEKVMESLKRLTYGKNEVIVFQILDPIEKSFAFGMDAVFVDLETSEEMTTQPFQIQKSYQEAFGNFLQKIKSECLNFGIDYNLIDTSQPFDKALLSYFKKRRRLN